VLCTACHSANDDRAKFCEQCGQPLELRCPACASPVRPGARFCSQCGHNLTPQSESSQIPVVQSSAPGRPLPLQSLQSLEEKLDHLQRYLPSHLTDKILAHHGRLQGERKLVTVIRLETCSRQHWLQPGNSACAPWRSGSWHQQCSVRCAHELF